MINNQILKILSGINLKVLKAYIILAIIGNILTYLRLLQFHDLYFPLTEKNVFFNKIFLFCCILLNFIQLKFNRNFKLYILNFLLSGFVLRTLFTYGIFELTVLYANWILIFFSLILNGISKENINYYRIGITGSFLTILMFGLSFFSSGFYKLIDPYWFNGTGLINFLKLDWINNGNSDFINSNIFIIINYISILFECSFLFLFFFNKTRKLSFIVYSSIGVLLFFPLNIFLIGYFSIIFTLPVFIFSFSKIEVSLKKINKWMLFGFSVIIILFAQENLKKIISRYYIIDEKSIPFKEIRDIEIDLSNSKINYRKSIFEAYYLKELGNVFNFSMLRYLPYQPVDLFSSVHTVGNFTYKISVESEKGETYDIDIFKKDSKRGKILNSYFQINSLQGAMYSFGDLIYFYHKLSNEELKNNLSVYSKKVYIPMLFWIEDYLNINIKRANFIISPTGKNCQIKFQHTLLSFDFSNSKLLYFEPDISDCDNGRHPELKNYLKDI